MSLIHCLFGKCKTSSLKYLFSNILIRIGHFELLLNIFYFVCSTRTKRIAIPRTRNMWHQMRPKMGINHFKDQNIKPILNGIQINLLKVNNLSNLKISSYSLKLIYTDLSKPNWIPEDKQAKFSGCLQAWYL